MLFRNYLGRVNPELAEAAEAPQPKQRKQRKAKDSSKRTERTLTLKDKIDIAQAEIGLVGKQVHEIKLKGEKELDHMRCLAEEAELRIVETKKETYEFKRDIITRAENPRTGKVSSERMVRYLEGKVQDKDMEVDKMRLKNSTLKSKILKLEQQLNQKEEMGEVLSVIDFDQLKIKDQQFLEKIEERNNELLRLKLTTGKTVQVLNDLKKKLSSHTSKTQSLRKEIAEKQEQTEKFNAELAQVQAERDKALKTNKGIRIEQSDSELPQVIDYIKLKAEVSELLKKRSDWERKIEIMELKKLSAAK